MFTLTDHALRRIEERRVDPLHLAAALEGRRIRLKPGGVVDYVHPRSGTVAVVNPELRIVVTVYRLKKGRRYAR